MRILIVEDSKIDRTMIEAKATSLGYDVICASNGEEALDLFVQQQPNLVITDWTLPGMDGASLCRKIREAPTQHYVYIILIAALEDTQSMVVGMEAGADDFVRKPIIFDEIHAHIRAGERVLNLEQTFQLQNQRLTQMSDELGKAHAQFKSDLMMAGEMQRKLMPPRDTMILGVRLERM